jgi:hypothetical protein
MARNLGNGRFGPSHRRVLKLLASAPRGRADPKFIAMFAIELFDLVEAGFVDTQAEAVRAGGQTIETVRVRITAAGRAALAAED